MDPSFTVSDPTSISISPARPVPSTCSTRAPAFPRPAPLVSRRRAACHAARAPLPRRPFPLLLGRSLSLRQTCVTSVRATQGFAHGRPDRGQLRGCRDGFRTRTHVDPCREVGGPGVRDAGNEIAPPAGLRRRGEMLAPESTADLPLDRSHPCARAVVAHDDAHRRPADIGRARGGESLVRLLPEAFGLVCVAAARTVRLRPFDVQLAAGAILHAGALAEVATGEGKTLVATLPVTLNAMLGKGVHVTTCPSYTSDAAADPLCVDLGGRRII